MSGSTKTTQRSVPSLLVLGLFVVLPVTVAFLISRQAAALQVRRKAIAGAHGWATENKNEGQRAWIVRGFHHDVEFEAVHLLREGGGTAWRVRLPLGHEVPSWVLVTAPGVDWPPGHYGTISTLVTRTELPPPWPGAPSGLLVRAAPEVGARMLLPAVVAALASPPKPDGWAISFVDDAVMIDGAGDLPEGEALTPWLTLGARLVRVFSPDAG